MKVPIHGVIIYMPVETSQSKRGRRDVNIGHFDCSVVLGVTSHRTYVLILRPLLFYRMIRPIIGINVIAPTSN